MCSVEIDGFREGVKHVRQNHPETLFEDKACPCIVCPKRFARMDHLKNHVYSHVNRIRPGLLIDFFFKHRKLKRNNICQLFLIYNESIR